MAFKLLAERSYPQTLALSPRTYKWNYRRSKAFYIQGPGERWPATPNPPRLTSDQVGIPAELKKPTGITSVTASEAVTAQI